MLEDDKYTVDDLVSNALNQKPVEFESSFNSLVLDKLRTAVETKKQEIATSMFNNNLEVETQEEE